MAPYPRESNSSGATGTLIAAVVIGMLILGVLAMIVLGFLFYFSVQQQDSQLTGVVLGEAGVGEPLPSEAQPAAEALPEQPSDQPLEDIDIEPGQPLPPDAVEAFVPEIPADSEAVESAEPSEPVVLPPADHPGKRLAELTPLEVFDIRLGDLNLVRLAKVAGRNHPSAIWAQPSADRGTCQISFPLQQAYQRLTGAAAVADASGEDAEIPAGAFRIYGDGNLLWDSGILEGYGVSKPLDIGVQGIRQVVLVTESDSLSEVSLFAWVDMQLAPEPSWVSP